MADMDWYLTPTAMISIDGETNVQAADSRGRQIVLGGMQVLIGRTEDAPTECMVGVPTGTLPPQGWTLLTPAQCAVEHTRLFGGPGRFGGV